MSELIDRDRVGDILDAVNGLEGLEALEEAGYAVVRAGMVPHLDGLDEAEQVLRRLRTVSGVIHDPAKAGAAATQIQQLRELALMVLGIDRGDVDPEAGP